MTRSIQTAIVGAVIMLFSAAALAQDVSAGSSEETQTPDARSQRTPVLVVHETWTPAPEVKPTAPGVKAQKGTKNESPAQAPGKPGSATVDARGKAASSNPAAPAPIVVGPSKAGQTILQDTTGNPAYDELARQAGARHGVDPNLIIAVMRQESGFNPRAVSYKGASGLMQLMPGTARRFGVVNIFDVGQNVDAGTRYLRFLLDTFNDDVNLVLAGYNAGENAVINSGYRVPRYRETQNYVRNISARYGSNTHRGSRQIASGKPMAPEAVAFSSSRLSNNY